MFRAALCVILALVIGWFVCGQSPTTEASHPYPGPDFDDCLELCLWPSLQPGGSGQLAYSICGDGTPQEGIWDDAVERWDLAMGPLMEFNLTSCAQGVPVRWESANQCGGTLIACFLYTYTDMGSYWRLDSGTIWVDKPRYTPYNENWRIFLIEHEWGHSLGLDHHTSTGPCTERSVMAYVIGDDPADTDCRMQYPSDADRLSARCHRASYVDSAVGAGSRVGVFRPNVSSTEWKEEYSLSPAGGTDRNFNFATNCDIPVVGDWNNDGTDTPGIFRPDAPGGAEWHLSDSPTGGSPFSFKFGTSTDLPVVGDWDGNGSDTIGIWRPGIAQFHLRNSNSAGSATYIFSWGGDSSDRPIVGDWDADPHIEVGVYRRSDSTWHLKSVIGSGSQYVVSPFAYGDAWDFPITGDWDQNGKDGIGVFRDYTGSMWWYLKNTIGTGPASHSFNWALISDKPLSGDWQGLAPP